MPHFRWLIAGMLLLAAVLNYIDRQALSILAPTVQGDLGISDAQYGDILNYFLIAYTVSLLLSGRLVDRIGVRLSMLLFVGWWSVSNMLTGLVRSAGTLEWVRLSLGLGEAGNWPGSTKAVSEWFPARERAVAIGLYTMGATLGATIAPWLILHLQGHFGWRGVFGCTGLLGLLWLLPWALLYRRPADHPWLTEREAAMLAAEAPSTGDQAPVTSPNAWRAAFGRRDVWVLMLARLITDPLWFFYQFWFAKYLFSDRHVSQEHLTVTWVIFLAADMGAVVGGLASALLIRRGRAVCRARMLVMLGCALLIPLSPLVPRVISLNVALALGMLAVFAHLAWLSNLSALVVDLIPRHLVATCFGIVAAGSAVGGLAMNKIVVAMLQNHSYTNWFTVMAFLHPAAWLLLRMSGVTGKRDQPHVDPVSVETPASVGDLRKA